MTEIAGQRDVEPLTGAKGLQAPPGTNGRQGWRLRMVVSAATVRLLKPTVASSVAKAGFREPPMIYNRRYTKTCEAIVKLHYPPVQ